jgi:hypothetical protein
VDCSEQLKPWLPPVWTLDRARGVRRYSRGMRKLVFTLALSTCVFAVTSIYFWNELRHARGEAESLSRPIVTLTSLERAMPQPRGAEPHASPGDSQVAPQAAAAGASTDDEKARQRILEEDFRDGARRKLTQLTDPTMRAQMLEEWKEANLPRKPEYARYLGISDADAERLIDVLAEQYLAESEAFARCTLQPPCNYRALSADSRAVQQRAITDLLGAEKQERFEEYTYSSTERHMVSRFLRDKIPAGSQLSEEDSERFIAALADERKLVETEIKQRGLEPFFHPMEGVAFAFSTSIFEPGNSAERLREAAEYNRRIHARAKAILTPQQLAAFEQMQEAAIVGLKYWMRQHERDLATRAGTRGNGG